MRTWLINRWTEFRASFWFLPGVMLALGLVFGLLSPVFDESLSEYVPPSFRASPTTARATLTALCGAMFTIAGIVFSTAIVALSITSSQLGPRLLRNFQQQAYTQVALGFCLATSVYCLVLLRSIDSFDGEVIIPQFSLLVASVLGVATLVVIIYYIHGVAHAMQSQNVVSDVANDLDDATQRLFPESIGQSSANDQADEASLEQDSDWKTVWDRFENAETLCVKSTEDGYLQAIQADTVIRIAKESDGKLRILARPGDYICEGQPLLDLRMNGELDESAEKKLQRAFLLGNMRTSQQDIECAVNDLVEIAVRALSPGVNDPFTAMACIDHLSSTLRRIAQRKLPECLQYDEDGVARVVAKPREFRTIVEAAFNQIRQNSASSVAVTIRLLEAIATIGRAVHRQADAEALRRQAQMILAQASNQGHVEQDLESIEERFEEAMETLQELSSQLNSSDSAHSPAQDRNNHSSDATKEPKLQSSAEHN